MRIDNLCVVKVRYFYAAVFYLSSHQRTNFYMRHKFIFRALSLLVFLFVHFNASAQDAKPDTVRIGIYITSIHDIDFNKRNTASISGSG